MPKSRFYKILGLPPSASNEEVRKKYRQLVMKYHPDRNSSPHAEEMFIQLTEAYSELIDKAPIAKKGTIIKTAEQEREERIVVARERYAAQVQREQRENEAYFEQLTRGIKWKIIRFSTVLGIILSFMMLLDLVLPHHLEKDEVTHYRRNVAYGTDGQVVSLIRTARNDYYWISRMTYSLYGTTRHVYVESSWLFHNTVRIISRDKLTYKIFNTHFTYYGSTWLIIPIFLLPGFTIFYKRKKISFTFLYYSSFYGVNTLILMYLFSGNRWAHILTLGFL